MSEPTCAQPVSDVRCPLLPEECLDGVDFADRDGCPDPPPPLVFFAEGSALVSDAAHATLDRIASEARRFDDARIRLVVTGESGPGERAQLAADRARAVVDILVARCVPLGRLTVEANGPMDFEGRDPPPQLVMLRALGCK